MRERSNEFSREISRSRRSPLLGGGIAGVFIAGLLLSCGCSSDSANGTDTGSRLGAPAESSLTAVAVVGGQAIEAVTLANIAAAQGITVREALNLALSDALLANEFERSGPAGAVAVVRRAIRSRIILEELQRKTLSRGAPTSKEMKLATVRHWWNYDRPPMARTVHVLVHSSVGTGDAQRAHSELLRQAVFGATSSEDFKARAKGIDSGALKVTMEDLPPVSKGGRVYDPMKPPPPGAPPAQFDPVFSQAAHAISSLNELSPPTLTPFGYHVIMLTEQIEERRVPLDKRIEAFQSEIFIARSSAAAAKLIKTARVESAANFDRAWNSYIELIDVTGAAP